MSAPGVSAPVRLIAAWFDPVMSNRTVSLELNATGTVFDTQRLFVNQFAVAPASQLFAPPPRQTSRAFENGAGGGGVMPWPK